MCQRMILHVRVQQKLESIATLVAVFVEDRNEFEPSYIYPRIRERIVSVVPVPVAILSVVSCERFHVGRSEKFERAGRAASFAYIGPLPQALPAVEIGCKEARKVGRGRYAPRHEILAGKRTVVRYDMKRKFCTCFII